MRLVFVKYRTDVFKSFTSKFFIQPGLGFPSTITSFPAGFLHVISTLIVWRHQVKVATVGYQLK